MLGRWLKVMMKGHTSTDKRKIAILCFEKDREKLKEIYDLLKEHAEVRIFFYSKEVWDELMTYDCIVAYLAAGIVVRGICGRLRSKWTDPAVIVLDKPLKHAVVLLGGHHGGNEVAKLLESIGLKAVVTTAMEYSNGLSVGVGFRKNVEPDEIIDAINRALSEIGAKLEDVRVIATLDAKRGSAIINVAERLKKPLLFVDADELNLMDLKETKAVRIGVKNVAEGCAIYASNTGELLLPKRVYGGVTVAIAR
uniref:Cobalamin biosynthesis protein n=1 Tax=Archaeoglobus fulgidus TaxID=2234 RepID=A0A7C3RL02_ARCFL